MKILAGDYGDTRTGLSLCDRTEFLASPLGTITEKSLPKAVEKIVYAVREYEAKMVVVGLPLNMDGTEGPRAAKCRRVADLLRNIMPDVPVEMWDERGTTKTAIHYMNETDTRGKKRKKLLDGEAAAIILESYLDFRHNMQAHLQNADN